MGEQQQPERSGDGKVAYGSVAAEYRKAILEDEMRRLTKPKSEESEKPKKDVKATVLQDPQGAIIRGRLVRFKPAMTRYAKNFCLRLISQDDLLLSVRNESRKLLMSLQSMGRLMIPPDQLDKCVRNILLTLQQMFEGITARELDIQMTTPIVDTIMGQIEKLIADRSATPDYEKIAELKGEQKGMEVDKDDPLAQFPPHIRKAIVTRLSMIGIDPRNMEALMGLAKQFGIEDPEAALEKLRNGEIPDELKHIL